MCDKLVIRIMSFKINQEPDLELLEQIVSIHPGVMLHEQACSVCADSQHQLLSPTWVLVEIIRNVVDLLVDTNPGIIRSVVLSKLKGVNFAKSTSFSV